MFFGLDLHKSFIQVAMISSDGKDYKTWKIETTPDSIIQFCKELSSDDKVVMETTFNTWMVYSVIKENCKASIVVANSMQVKAIAHAKVKTDKVDAKILAHLLKCDFIPEVHVPEKSIWEIRKLISHRKLIGKQRTALANSLKSVFNNNLLNAPRLLFGPQGQKWIQEQNLSEMDKFLVENIVSLVSEIDKQLKKIDEKLIELGAWNEEVKILMTIPGIGVNSAMCILSSIEDIERFKTPEQLSSYFGLTPRISQSANHCYHGRISKAGNSTARWYLVEAANQLAINGTPLSATYYKIRKKKGHNIAVTALARKITVLIWHMLKKKEPYRYAVITAYLKNKLRSVSPGLPQPRKGESPKTIEALYKHVQLPTVSEGSEAEKRTAKVNKRRVTLDRKFFGLDKTKRGKNAAITK